MTLDDFLDIQAEKMTRAVHAMPEYLFRDWGSPPRLKTDNVVATLLAMDEFTVIDRRLLPTVLDPLRVPVPSTANAVWADRTITWTFSLMDYRPRNYFVRHAVDLSVLGSLGVDTSPLNSVFERNQADFLWLWYMPHPS
jgi:hypothetical protein